MPELKIFDFEVLLRLVREEAGPLKSPDFNWDSPLDFALDIAKIIPIVKRLIAAVKVVEKAKHPEYKYFPSEGLPEEIKQRAVVALLWESIELPGPLFILKLVIDSIINDIAFK